MAYKQSPFNVIKGQMTNKAAGLAHGDSMAMQLKDPKTGKKLDEFGTPIPEGFTADAPEIVGGRVLSDINTSRGTTFSIGDEERDFEGNIRGGVSLPVHIAYDRHERGLPPAARGLGTTRSGQINYTPDQMQQVINAVTSQNAPINEARRNLNAANYSQAEIDLYNEQEKKSGTNRIFRRKPGQRDKKPRSIRSVG